MRVTRKWCRSLGFGLAAFATLLAGPAAGQDGVVEGRVLDPAGRPIQDAAVSLLSLPDSVRIGGLATDRLGRFHFGSIPRGSVLLRVDVLGYVPFTQRVTVGPLIATSIEVRLEPVVVPLPGVGVEVSRARERFSEQAGATARDLVREELKRLPGLGEADVLRAIEILPGVVSTSDYTSAFNVRGGSADQNLILLDGIPIYNPFHLGGLFSVFNADVIARAELLAGGFPAEYGGRVASVLSVESDAAGVGTDVNAGLSLLATRVAVGTDLPNIAGLSNTRMRASLRRSYFDVLLEPVFDFPYHLTDLQLHAETWTGSGGRLTVSAYTGRDVLDFAQADSTFPLRLRWQWGNDLAGIGWTHPLGGGRTLEVRGGYTRFGTSIRFPDFDDTDVRGRIHQWLARADVDLGRAGPLDLRGGMEVNRFRYANLAVSGGTEFGSGRDIAWLLGSYAQARWRPDEAWLIEAGIRADHWAPGAGASATVTSPRLAAKRFFGDGDVAVKLAVGRFAQFLHSLRDEELPLGIDIWILAGERAPHVVSDQVQGGVEAFLPRGWFVSLEAYRRTFDGVVTNNFADDPNDNLDDVIAGTGLSYGADLFLRRDAGRVRPTLAVSWLRATRDFEDPTLGLVPAPLVRYPPVFDRRLDVELVVQAELANGYELGARWNLGTGLPFTRPLAGYRLYTYELTDGGRRSIEPDPDDALLAIELGSRNAERYPTYHRLDVSARRTFRRSWGSFTPYLDILNVYNRKNPLFYFYEFDAAPPRRSGVSMFPLLPTFGVEVRF